MSRIIRRRRRQAGQSFRANDNISGFIEAGEMEELRLEVEGQLHEVLQALVIDTENDHNTAGTAGRVARMFMAEVFAGRYAPAPPVTSFPNVTRLSELMLVGPVTVRSACPHHLCPVIGKVWIGLLPSAGSDLIGLSKYARLCDWVMSRPQIQEEAVVMLADELERRTRPEGLAVAMEADHFCMHWRGVRDDQPVMVNSVMRGAFLTDADLRREFLSLRGQGHGQARNRFRAARTRDRGRAGRPRQRPRSSAAFEQLLRLHNQLLFRTARSILRNDAEAEEVVQEAWLRIWRGLKGYRGDSRFRPGWCASP